MLPDIISFGKRLRKALSSRQYKFCRLVHAGADGFPGLVIDQYDTTIVIQTSTANAESVLPTVLETLNQILAPTALVLRNDSISRGINGLPQYTRVIKGVVHEKTFVHENGCAFYINLLSGQKTGWFYDQRDNRSFIAQLAREQSVLDAYSYSGGFTLHAAIGGAASILAIDRSEAALALAELSTAKNNTRNSCRFSKGEVFSELAQRLTENECYGLVICDPPAFSKNYRSVHIKLKRRGYRKLVQLAAGLTGSEGFLFVTSCSQHLTLEDFLEEVNYGLSQSKRSTRVVRVSGASQDHPSNPVRFEAAYLKTILLQIV